MKKKKLIRSDEHQNLIPIFQLSPESTTTAKCKCIGTCNDIEKLTDEVIEIEDEKKEHNILNMGKVCGYDIIGKYCICNITGDYLIKNNKLPVYYLSVIYTKQFVTGCLFNIMLYITIDPECIKRMNNPQKYVNAIIEGKYTIEVITLEETEFVNKVKPFLIDRVMVKYVNEFSNSDTDEKKKGTNE